ncbi:hypothetical protein B0A55_10653 [Friedmanniomyces simplex]|uniref:C2H2-type domain-containing protein n=1 Tax=Friedmanniomyces simplex TaxID=329884 RepID=A0A4U0WSW0_9PEZI|nr:hypothetical protein B0A55_10653 [Friedmanniomyces simplex]
MAAATAGWQWTIGELDEMDSRARRYLPLRDFDSVTNALNFSTPDCHVIGGCDLYTTKAAGGDKKLYRNIEHSLESQYESLVRLSASLSPPYRSAASDDGKTSDQQDGGHRKKRSRTVEPPEIDLSRASPFGPLSQITARRTFAYLIATLNASHPDYDFSHLLRASDFHKERSLRSIMATVDSTLQNLRPKPSLLYLAPPVLSRSAPVVANSMGNEVWSPRMWSLIDKEMGLRQCEKYSFVPEEDPFDGEDGGGSVWSMHYFFFSKERKRVCYLHLRGLSVISHSPVHAPTYLLPQRERVAGAGRGRPGWESVSVGEGAGKRASYWLGSRVLEGGIETSGCGEDDDDEEGMMMGGVTGGTTAGACYDVEDEEDEVEAVPDMSLDDIRSELAEGNCGYDAEEEEGVEEGLLQKLDRQVSCDENALATIAKDHKLFLGRRTEFHIEKLSLRGLIELFVTVEDLLQSLDASAFGQSGVPTLPQGNELDLDLDEIYTANLEHLLLSLQHQLIDSLLAKLIDLLRRHVRECQRDQKRRCQEWFFEYPDARHPESTTWPWSLKPSLAVLWGVCWMFHGPDNHHSPTRFDGEGNLVDQWGEVVVPSHIVQFVQQQRRQAASFYSAGGGGFQNLDEAGHPLYPGQPITMSELEPPRVSPTQPPQAANLRDNTSPSSHHHHLRHAAAAAAARAPDQAAHAAHSLAPATRSNEYSSSTAPTSAWPTFAPQVWLPQDESDFDTHAYPAGPIPWPPSLSLSLSSVPPPHPLSQPRFDVHDASLLPPPSRVLTPSPQQIRLTTAGVSLHGAQQPQDPTYHSAPSASSRPLHESRYPYYPHAQNPLYNMAQVQAPEAPMNGMHHHHAVSPGNPHSPLHDPALMAQGGRKRSHSEMSHQGMLYEVPPPPYPPPPHLQQQEAPRSRAGSVASAGPGSPSPGAGDEYSPRGSRSFKRGDPPMNTENRYFCNYSAECEGQTFDRKCEWSKHMDKHDRPYRCPHSQCAKLQGFTYSGGLLRHEREVHGKHGGPKAQLSCPYEDCKRHTGKGFTRKENLNEHIRRVHNDKSAPPPPSSLLQEHDAESAASAAFKADLQEAIAGADQHPLPALPYPEPVPVEQYIPEPAEMVNKRRRVDVTDVGVGIGVGANDDDIDDDLVAPPVGEEDIKQREIHRLRAENAEQAARMREMETREAQRELRMNQLEEMLRAVHAQSQAQQAQAQAQQQQQQQEQAQQESIEHKILAVAGHT